MTFEEYQKHAMRTKTPNKTMNEHLNEAALGLGGEAGEVIDIIKKVLIHGHSLSPAEILEEGGDILWYLTLLLDTCGFTLNDAAKHNVCKLVARYPNGFNSHDSIHRGGEVIDPRD